MVWWCATAGGAEVWLACPSSRRSDVDAKGVAADAVAKGVKIPAFLFVESLEVGGEVEVVKSAFAGLQQGVVQ